MGRYIWLSAWMETADDGSTNPKCTTHTGHHNMRQHGCRLVQKSISTAVPSSHIQYMILEPNAERIPRYPRGIGISILCCPVRKFTVPASGKGNRLTGSQEREQIRAQMYSVARWVRRPQEDVMKRQLKPANLRRLQTSTPR